MLEETGRMRRLSEERVSGDMKVTLVAVANV